MYFIGLYIYLWWLNDLLPYLSFGWQVDIDVMLQSLIDSCSGSEGFQLCADAACVLLELIKIIITKVSVSKLLNVLA